MRTAFGMPVAAILEVRDLTFGPLAVTELRCDSDDYGQSAPIPEQDGFMVSLQLRSNANHQVWEDGKPLPYSALTEGMTSIFDLRRAVRAHSIQPFHSLNFALPLRSLADTHTHDDSPLYRFELERASRLAVRDPVIRALGEALLPALSQPEFASRLFIDHVLFALRAHVVQRYGAAPLDRAERRGGLATWQEQRAKAFIDAHVAETISLADIARECSLSVAQFARAFKRSTGVPPHQFLTERRVDRARGLLLHTQLPLADVAIRCGFADQSHFTKVFRRVIGVSPGGYRAASRSPR